MNEVKNLNFKRGHYSTRGNYSTWVTFNQVQCAHFYQNDTYYSDKRVIFLRRIMNECHYSKSKKKRGHYSALHRDKAKI